MNARKKTSFYGEVGFRLRQVRERRRVSQKHMGGYLGVTQQTVQRYETGNLPIPCMVIDTYARTFKAPVGFFFGETDHTEPDRAAMLLASEIMGIQDTTVRKCLFNLTGAISKIERGV